MAIFLSIIYIVFMFITTYLSARCSESHNPIAYIILGMIWPITWIITLFGLVIVIAKENQKALDEAAEKVGTQRSWELLRKDPVVSKILERMRLDVAGALEALENSATDNTQTDQQIRQNLVRYTTLKRAYNKIVNNEE